MRVKIYGGKEERGDGFFLWRYRENLVFDLTNSSIENEENNLIVLI